MEFSVVIPSLNSPIVQQTIDAICDQEYDMEKVEIIVVGLDEAGLIKPGHHLIFDDTTRPFSPAAARNRGAAQAHGSIIAFTDADCLPRKDWLKVLAGRFKLPSVNIVGGGVDFIHTGYWSLADNLSMFYEYLSIHTPGIRQQLPSLNLAIRAQVFAEAGGFDERYPRPSGEDADLTIRLRKKGYCLDFEPRAIVTHSPPRHRFLDLLRHSYYQGMFSTKIDPRYANEEGLPGLLRTRVGIILAAPLLAGLVAGRIFVKYPKLLRYWYTLPAIYIAKIAWCVGAARYPAEKFA